MNPKRRGGPGQGNRPSSPQQDNQKAAPHLSTTARSLSAFDLAVVHAIAGVVIVAFAFVITLALWVIA